MCLDRKVYKGEGGAEASPPPQVFCSKKLAAALYFGFIFLSPHREAN